MVEQAEVLEKEDTIEVVEAKDLDSGAGKEEVKAIEESENDDESGESEEQEAKTDDEAKPVKKNGFKKRIERLNRQKADAQKEVEYWKSVALKGEKSTQEEKPEIKATGKPKADDFESHEDYVEALTDYKLEQREIERQKKSETEHKQKLELEQVSKWHDKVEEYSSKIDDFDDVMENAPDVPVSEAKKQAIMDSDVGVLILYELAKDEKEALRISKLPDVAAIREIGKIEARIQSRDTKTIKQTKAPAPISPVKGSGKINYKSLSDPNLSQADYERLRREQSRK